MGLVGKYVSHGAFGKGKITEINRGLATVVFGDSVKCFQIADAIESGTLTLVDDYGSEYGEQTTIQELYGISQPEMENRRYNYIDLFAGAGGLSEGFVSNGFEPISHVEMDESACNTLKTRVAYYYLKNNGEIDKYYQYLRGELSRESFYDLIPKEQLDTVVNATMSDATMPEIFSRIDISMQQRNVDHVDLIIGGPPCQAYSIAGRGRKCMDTDPRNTLYKLYLQALERYTPTMFVFENVPGLLSAGNGEYLQAIKEGFEERGYNLEMRLLLASQYGVLQNRKRIILVGWKKDSNLCYPSIRQLPEDESARYRVANLLEDLPAIQAGESANHYAGKYINEYLHKSGLRTECDILTQHEARPHTERDREIYRHAIESWDSGHVRLRYTDLPENLMTHKNRESYLDRFKVVADDLPTCQTMVAHISKDGHYFIHPDINQARSITIREAARIQSFPDSYYFEGGRTAAFRQIGNAVPPLLAKAIAEAIKVQLEENTANE